MCRGARDFTGFRDLGMIVTHSDHPEESQSILTLPGDNPDPEYRAEFHSGWAIGAVLVFDASVASRHGSRSSICSDENFT